MTSALLRWIAVAASCVGAILSVPLLHAFGLSGTALVVASVPVFSATFTGHDVLHRIDRGDLGPFLRRRMTANLAMVSACAVGACALAPIPEDAASDPSRPRVRAEGRVSPPAEGSRGG